MSPHDERHAALLRERVTGDRPASDAELEALLAACAECRAQLEALERVAGRLDAAGAEYRDVREEAARPRETAPGEEIVDDFVRARAAEVRAPLSGPGSARTAGSTGSRRVFWMGVAAAAAAVVAMFLLRERALAPGDRPAPLYLGPESPGTILAPLGEVDGYERFAWELDLPPGGWFEVRVFDVEAGAGAGAVPLLESPRLREPSWTPPEEDLARLPSRIRFEVQPFDATGQPFGSAASGEARRGPR